MEDGLRKRRKEGAIGDGRRRVVSQVLLLLHRSPLREVGAKILVRSHLFFPTVEVRDVVRRPGVKYVDTPNGDWVGKVDSEGAGFGVVVAEAVVTVVVAVADLSMPGKGIAEAKEDV